MDTKQLNYTTIGHPNRKASRRLPLKACILTLLPCSLMILLVFGISPHFQISQEHSTKNRRRDQDKIPQNRMPSRQQVPITLLARLRMASVKKKIHLVILTHGLHSNLGADMLYLKESIDAAARNKRDCTKERHRRHRDKNDKSKTSLNE